MRIKLAMMLILATMVVGVGPAEAKRIHLGKAEATKAANKLMKDYYRKHGNGIFGIEIKWTVRESSTLIGGRGRAAIGSYLKCFRIYVREGKGQPYKYKARWRPFNECPVGW